MAERRVVMRCKAQIKSCSRDTEAAICVLVTFNWCLTFFKQRKELSPAIDKFSIVQFPHINPEYFFTSYQKPLKIEEK